MKYRFTPTAITVDYDELKAPEVSLSEFGWVVTRTLRCAWGNRHMLARQLYGRSGRNDGGDWWVFEPDMFALVEPTEGQDTDLFCSGVSIRGWGDPSGGDPVPSAREHIPVGARGMIEYVFSELSVQYSSAPWFYEERFDSGGEVVGVTGGRTDELYWRSDHAKVDKQVTRPLVRVPGGLWTVVLLGVWAIPDEVFSMKGKVNTIEMEALNLTVVNANGLEGRRKFAVGSVLYLDAVISENTIFHAARSNGRGQAFSRVELSFAIKENGHNYFFRPGEGATGTWDALDHDDAGASPYDPYITADLRKVIGQA